MYRLFAIAALLLVLAAPPGASAGDDEIVQTQEVGVGETILLKLPGEPDLGYKWRINEKRSSGLDLIDVDQVGWLIARSQQSMFFKKSSILNVSVTGKSAGQADVAMDYYRRVGGRMFTRTSVYRFVVKPRTAKAP